MSDASILNVLFGHGFWALQRMAQRGLLDGYPESGWNVVAWRVGVDLVSTWMAGEHKVRPYRSP